MSSNMSSSNAGLIRMYLGRFKSVRFAELRPACMAAFDTTEAGVNLQSAAIYFCLFGGSDQ